MSSIEELKALALSYGDEMLELGRARANYMVEARDVKMIADSAECVKEQLLTALTAAQARAETAPITDALISKAARFISDRQSKECNVNADDNWKVYGDEFIEDVRDMFAHVGLKPATDSAIGGKGA